MKLQNVSLRRNLFGTLKSGWGSPMTIGEFVQKFYNDEERKAVLQNQSNIKFISSEGSVLEFQEGLRQYHIAEKAYLDSFLAATFSQADNLSFS